MCPLRRSADCGLLEEFGSLDQCSANKNKSEGSLRLSLAQRARTKRYRVSAHKPSFFFGLLEIADGELVVSTGQRPVDVEGVNVLRN